MVKRSKSERIIRFALIGLILLLILVAALIGGQYAGGAYVLQRLQVSFDKLELFSLYNYYNAYHTVPVVGIFIQQGLAISVAPAALILLISGVAIFSKKKPIELLHGEARFAKPFELKRSKLFLTEDTVNETGFPPVILGKVGDKYIADYSQDYTMLNAPPASGKTTGFVIPNLLMYPHSVIVFDPKYENFQKTSGYRHTVLKQKVYRFSPDSQDFTSHCWNPLDYISTDPIKTLADIKTLTAILIPADAGQNQSFFLSARSALDGILLYLFETDEEERTLFRAHQINNDPLGFDKWVPTTIGRRRVAGKPLSETCERLLWAYAKENEKKRDTTKGIINTYLDIFSEPLCRAATSRSDFRFESVRLEPISIYLSVTPPSIAKYQRLLNLFFSQAITVNTSVLPEDGEKGPDGKSILKYQCLTLLDEFTGLGPIEIIRSSSGYTRGYNMRYAIIFQNLGQVYSDKTYGRDGGKSLLDTVTNEIVFTAESNDDAAEYSKRLGNTTLKHKERNKTRGKQTSTSENTSYHARPLMHPQEIQRMSNDEQLIFMKNGKSLPIKCEKIKYYEDEELLSRSKITPVAVPMMQFN